MKRTLFLRPLKGFNVLYCTIFLVFMARLCIGNQAVANPNVEYSKISTLPQATTRYGWPQPPNYVEKFAFSDSLASLHARKGSFHLPGDRVLSAQPDTVLFQWTTTGKNAAWYQSALYIDSAYKSGYMSCCDQLQVLGPLTQQLSLIKGTTPLITMYCPKSSYYPLYLVGEGTLLSSGAPGWFFLPPNIYASNKPLKITGKGPHKVYWLGADHPDDLNEGAHYSESDLLNDVHQQPFDTVVMQRDYDFLGRPTQGSNSIRFEKHGSKWRKVIKLK